jgi:hypothetical protein
VSLLNFSTKFKPVVTSRIDSKKKEKSKDKKSKKAERNSSFKFQPIVSKLPSLSRVGKPAVILLQIPNETDSIIATVIGKFARELNA